MRRTVRLVAFVLTAVLAATACGSGGDERADTVGDTEKSRTTTKAPTTTAKRAALTEADLASALLTVQDMPTGWAAVPEEEEDDDELCDAAREMPEPSVEASAQFAEDDLGPFVYEAIGVMPQIQDYFAALREQLESCREFTDVDDDGTKTTGSVQPLSFPKLGEETVAVRLSGEGGMFSFSGDMVVVRLGDDLVVGFISLGVMGSKIDGFEGLVREGVERAEKLASR